MRKCSHHPSWNGWEKLWYILTVNSTGNILPYNQEKTPTSQFLPEEWRVWTPFLASQLKNAHFKYGFAKHLTLKAKEAWVNETHKTVANKDTVITGSKGLPMAILPEELRKKHSSLSLSLKEAYSHTLKAAAWGSSFQFSTHLGTDCIPPWRPESQ